MIQYRSSSKNIVARVKYSGEKEQSHLLPLVKDKDLSPVW